MVGAKRFNGWTINRGRVKLFTNCAQLVCLSQIIKTTEYDGKDLLYTTSSSTSDGLKILHCIRLMKVRAKFTWTLSHELVGNKEFCSSLEGCNLYGDFIVDPTSKGYLNISMSLRKQKHILFFGQRTVFLRLHWKNAILETTITDEGGPWCLKFCKSL